MQNIWLTLVLMVNEANINFCKLVLSDKSIKKSM